MIAASVLLNGGHLHPTGLRVGSSRVALACDLPSDDGCVFVRRTAHLMSRHADGVIEDIEPAVVRDHVALLLLIASEHV